MTESRGRIAHVQYSRCARVPQAEEAAGCPLSGQDGTVEYAAVLGDRGQRQRPAADLHGDEVVADRPRLPRRHTRARAQDGVQRLAAATGVTYVVTGGGGARGEPLVVVLVAVEHQDRPVTLEDRHPAADHGPGGAVLGAARVGGLVEDDHPEG